MVVKHMNGYRFFRSLQALIGLVIFFLGGLAACILIPCSELSREATYRHRYGSGWHEVYEQEIGSLAQAHTRVVLGFAGAIFMICMLVWLARLLGAKPRGSRRNRSRRPRDYGSPVERVIRYRANALPRIYFGVFGILVSVVVVVFRFGIFADHENEVILGMFIFLAGYVGVISGCRWWLKAKQWHDAVLLIAFLPLVIACIPFVRLIFLVVPVALPAGMVMMPLVLIAVVLALPDRSGISKRKSRWHPGSVNRDRPTPGSEDRTSIRE
jgi:hypothetical protein